MAKNYINQTPIKKNYINTSTKVAPVQKNYISTNTPKKNYINSPKQEGAFNWTMNQLIKPISMASNALEDAGKTIAFPVAKLAGYKGNWEDAKKMQGIDFLGHQKDVLRGNNKRTYSDITRDAFKDGSKSQQIAGQVIGYGGDMILDPLNKVKIASLTAKGLAAEKTGKLALSAAEQAQKGERALLQLGKYNVLPNVGNRVLAATTRANDLARGTEIGKKVFNAGAALNGKIRPAGVSRDEFKILTDAKTAARDTIGYTQDKAIEFAKGLEKTLSDRKATQLERASLLHAVEKGDEKLAPVAFQDLWKKGVDFKAANEDAWKALGGNVIDDYGMAHVATKEVAEAARKKAFKGQGGFKLTSTNTPQDIHREWVKVDGKVTNIKDSGIKYDPARGYLAPIAKESKPGIYTNSYKPVKVEQASAMEINNALGEKGKSGIFREDLPISAAQMGISTGKKQAASEFLKATEGLKSEEAKALVNEVHNKMVNPESLRKAVQLFDSVQNIWKAQALLGIGYHAKNIAGNLWNNYLAGINNPTAYAMAGNLQNNIRRGVLSNAEKKLVQEMEQHGILGTGWYGGDIAKNVSNEIDKASLINPFSQKFAGYRANKAVGSAIEDNAKIAHYLFKRNEGYGAKEAADSVKKYLFDYGDLTDVEQGLLKRFMPFYTWTSKNVPLQIQQFVENPGKFSKIATAKKDVEQGVDIPDEKYMSDYMKGNAPIRIKKDENGNTLYFLAGSWLPAASAIKFLSDAPSELLGQLTPALKLPYENLTGNGTFFKNSLGEYDKIQKYPGQKISYLGLDLDPMTVNNLRNIRPLNELNNLNPAGIFGGKNSPSIWQGAFDNASNVRGGQKTPETTQADRAINSVYKFQAYNPEDQKKYYEKDTQDKVDEFNSAIDRALSNNQTGLAKNLIQQMAEFVQERDGKPNEDMQMYGLLGDRYFEDQAKNKQAEKERKQIREEMKQQIQKGIMSGNYGIVTEALKKDPTYAKEALNQALKDKLQNGYSEEQKKMMYEIEQLKKKKALSPFYKNQ